jgi:HTH-type transcriptional regulator / antitoxin HigA
VQVINRYRLRDFWQEYTGSEKQLRAWHQFISSFNWEGPEALQATFPSAVYHEDLVAFDVRGSTYFLITSIDFGRSRICVRDVQVHSEFRTDAWKELVGSDETSSEPMEKSYGDLVGEFELRPIQNDDQLRQASEVVDELLRPSHRSVDEQDYLDVLAIIVADYENRHVPIPPVSGAEVLRALIMEHRLSQVELIPMLGRKEKVAALLQGKRPLELRQVTRASRYFKLPAEVFMDPDDLEPDEV